MLDAFSPDPDGVIINFIQFNRIIAWYVEQFV